MATLLKQIENLEKLNEKAITKQIFLAVKKAEKSIINLNRFQLLQGKNSDDNIVGEYSPFTEGFAEADGIFTDKTPNSPYNFNWTGEFLKGFNLTLSGEDAIISSTGIGTGEKEQFLTTNNLFGLTDENLAIIIQKEILPFIHNFSRKTLNI